MDIGRELLGRIRVHEQLLTVEVDPRAIDISAQPLSDARRSRVVGSDQADDASKAKHGKPQAVRLGGRFGRVAAAPSVAADPPPALDVRPSVRPPQTDSS